MAFKKKTSKAKVKAETRIASVKSISSTEDLGNGLTVAAYQDQINAVSEKLEIYNAKLSDADEAGNVLKAEEKKLNALSERILKAVGVKYGMDSDQYEKAGGTRKSEYRKASRKGKKPNA